MSKRPNKALMARIRRIFISPNVRAASLPDARQRSKILIYVLLVSILSAIVLTLAMGSFYLINSQPLFLAATMISLATTIGYLCTLWYFKRRQTVLPATNLYAFITLFSTVAPCVITGGISASPYLPLILVVPIFLFLIAGREYGIYWSMVAVISVATLMIMEAGGFVFPQIIPESTRALFAFTAWLTSLSLLLLGLIAYEMNSDKLTKRITKERSQYAHEARHDPLTGLANRKQFFARANEALSRSLSRQHKAAVIFIDLDDFKLINDSFGHEVGDEVLTVVARRLQSNIRSVDTVARIGGDEFAVVLYSLNDTKTAEHIVEKLQRVLKEPLVIGQHSLFAPGSIGLAVAPDQGQEAEDLLRKADEAMYRAKETRLRPVAV